MTMYFFGLLTPIITVLVIVFALWVYSSWFAP